MNLRSCIRVLIAAAIVLAAASAASAAGDHAKPRPFWGTYEGDVHWEYAVGTCPTQGGYTTVSEGAGQTTQMGRTLMTERHCAGVDSMPLDGLATLTAANGDQVWAAFIPGTGRVLWFDPDTFTFAQEGSYNITGGTGRFEGASGSIKLTVIVTPTGDPVADPTIHWPAQFVIEGAIHH